MNYILLESFLNRFPGIITFLPCNNLSDYLGQGTKRPLSSQSEFEIIDEQKFRAKVTHLPPLATFYAYTR